MDISLECKKFCGLIQYRPSISLPVADAEIGKSLPGHACIRRFISFLGYGFKFSSLIFLAYCENGCVFWKLSQGLYLKLQLRTIQGSLFVYGSPYIYLFVGLICQMDSKNLNHLNHFKHLMFLAIPDNCNVSRPFACLKVTIAIVITVLCFFGTNTLCLRTANQFHWKLY